MDHPRINKTQWTEEESAELVDLVKKHGDRNWCLIAESLKVKKTRLVLGREKKFVKSFIRRIGLP